MLSQSPHGENRAADNDPGQTQAQGTVTQGRGRAIDSRFFNSVDDAMVDTVKNASRSSMFPSHLCRQETAKQGVVLQGVSARAHGFRLRHTSMGFKYLKGEMMTPTNVMKPLYYSSEGRHVLRIYEFSPYVQKKMVVYFRVRDYYKQREKTMTKTLQHVCIRSVLSFLNYNQQVLIKYKLSIATTMGFR